MDDSPANNRFPTAATAWAVSAAEARRLVGGRREAILDRLASLGRDLLPPDHSLLRDLMTGGGGGGSAETATAPARRMGETYLEGLGGTAGERRRSGCFYTPAGIVDRIFDLFWDGFLAKFKAGEAPAFCDPALGCGFFPLGLIDRLLASSGVRAADVAEWAASSLYGVDTDPGAVYVARVSLWLSLSTPRREFVPDAGHFMAGDSLTGPSFTSRPAPGFEPGAKAFDWARRFSDVAGVGGFDFIAANPPYEVLTGFGRNAGHADAARTLRQCGMYRDSLKGQINLYRCFIERSLDLLKPGGTLAMITPLSLARDANSAPLRKRLLGECAAERWLVFDEKEAVFRGVTQAACIFRAVKGGGAAREVVVGTPSGDNRFSPGELAAMGGADWVLPLLDGADAALFHWVARHAEAALADIVEARVGEVDQTVYRDCMRDNPTGCLLARGVHLAPFKLNVDPAPGKERFLELDGFLAKKGGMAERCRERAARPRVAQLGIRNMLSRPRLIAAIAPAGVYLGNSLNVYYPKDGYTNAFVAGMLNSALLDWLFRVGSGNNNINLHEMLRLPFPAGPSPVAVAAVAEAYAECERLASGDGAGLAEARGALDLAVWELYGVPEELRFAPERGGRGGE